MDSTEASNNYSHWKFDASGRKIQTKMAWHLGHVGETQVDRTDTIDLIRDGDGVSVKRVDTKVGHQLYPDTASTGIVSEQTEPLGQSISLSPPQCRSPRVSKGVKDNAISRQRLSPRGEAMLRRGQHEPPSAATPPDLSRGCVEKAEPSARRQKKALRSLAFGYPTLSGSGWILESVPRVAAVGLTLGYILCPLRGPRRKASRYFPYVSCLSWAMFGGCWREPLLTCGLLTHAALKNPVAIAPGSDKRAHPPYRSGFRLQVRRSFFLGGLCELRGYDPNKTAKVAENVGGKPPPVFGMSGYGQASLTALRWGKPERIAIGATSVATSEGCLALSPY